MRQSVSVRPKTVAVTFSIAPYRHSYLLTCLIQDIGDASISPIFQGQNIDIDDPALIESHKLYIRCATRYISITCSRNLILPGQRRTETNEEICSYCARILLRNAFNCISYAI